MPGRGEKAGRDKQAPKGPLIRSVILKLQYLKSLKMLQEL